MHVRDRGFSPLQCRRTAHPLKQRAARNAGVESRAAPSPTRSRARPSSPAQRFSGSATSSASSSERQTSEALAASVEDADGVTFVPALAGLGAALASRARGALFGLTTAPTAPTSPAPCSMGSPYRSSICSTPWRLTRAHPAATSRRRRRRREQSSHADPKRPTQGRDRPPTHARSHRLRRCPYRRARRQGHPIH